MRTIVSSTFRDYFLHKFPALGDNQDYWRFMRYLCFSSFHDEMTNELVIPAQAVAEKIYEVKYDHKFNAGDKLIEFKTNVLNKLEWTDPSWLDPDYYNSWISKTRQTTQIGKARQIVNLGFDEETLFALSHELSYPPLDPVDFVSGKVFSSERRLKTITNDNIEYDKQINELPINDTQKKIIAYLSNINAGRIFPPLIEKNRDFIDAAIKTIPSATSQTIQKRILASIWQNPYLYYMPSANMRTCRLTARGENITGLKSVVRKAVCKGWTEADLRSSQFAILAAKLDAPLAQKLLHSDENLWSNFYRCTHGRGGEPPAQIKKAYKLFVYAMCFGMKEHELKSTLKRNDIPMLWNHPLIKELLYLRDKWLEKIDEAGGENDIYGVWQAMDREINPMTKKMERWQGSVAAAVIQSIEMEIIAPIFDVAKENEEADQFKIYLFQHDGATISFQSEEKKKRAQEKLKKAVEKRAAELGVYTTLDFTDL